jgi:hypothetical protein
MHRLLDLAEERARQIEEKALVEAGRLRVEAQQHVEAVLSDLESKIDQKKDALRQLSMLEFGMVQRVERAGIPSPERALATAMTPPSPPAVVDSEAVESFAASPAHEEDR